MLDAHVLGSHPGSAAVTSDMSLGKLLHLSVPRYLYLENGNKSLVLQTHELELNQ